MRGGEGVRGGRDREAALRYRPRGRGGLHRLLIPRNRAIASSSPGMRDSIIPRDGGPRCAIGPGVGGGCIVL